MAVIINGWDLGEERRGGGRGGGGEGGREEEGGEGGGRRRGGGGEESQRESPHLLLLETLEPLLVTSIQSFLAVCRPLYLTGSDEHLSRPVLHPLVTSTQVLLQVHTASSETVFEGSLHHVLHITQPALHHALQLHHVLKLHLLTLRGVHVCGIMMVVHLGHVQCFDVVKTLL